jgi:hypothetical protein
MAVRTRPQPSRRKVRPEKRKTQKVVPRGIRVDVSVADRVKSRKRLEEVQREIEDLTRQVDQATSLLKKVILRKELASKEEERQKLYEMLHLVNTGPSNVNTFEKAITIQERRAQNNETRKRYKERMNTPPLMTRSPIRVKMPSLKMKNRMAINATRLKELQRKQIENGYERFIRFGEEIRTREAREKAATDDAVRLVRKMQTSWVNPEVKRAREEQSELETQQKILFQTQKEDSDIPKELLNMMTNAKKRRSRPMPRLKIR